MLKINEVLELDACALEPERRFVTERGGKMKGEISTQASLPL